MIDIGKWSARRFCEWKACQSILRFFCIQKQQRLGDDWDSSWFIQEMTRLSNTKSRVTSFHVLFFQQSWKWNMDPLRLNSSSRAPFPPPWLWRKGNIDKYRQVVSVKTFTRFTQLLRDGLPSHHCGHVMPNYIIVESDDEQGTRKPNTKR